MTPEAAIQQAIDGTPYAQYVYGYPHKTAYRPLSPPRELSRLWAHEFETGALRRESLFLYVHVPFCEMRCGFCNLFTTVRPEESVERGYLDALARQAKTVSSALGPVSYARLAIGGGTPTWLTEAQLDELFALVSVTMGADVKGVPCSVETSPETATDERLAVLERYGVDRVSIGVQSFFDDEAKSMGRPQKRASVERALERIRARAFATLNIDLIYGASEQSVRSWIENIQLALRYAPEELYLYPLYVRPLTGLAKSAREWDDHRVELYRAGRDYLCSHGYKQVSMRMFRRIDAPTANAPAYECQRDGMVGLGCGARSYTSSLHYSEEWAVGARSVREILHAYIDRPERDFALARYGIELDEHERLRRAAILSLLSDEGLAEGPRADALTELSLLIERGLARREGARVVLTDAGLERADAVGPALFSASVRHKMQAFSLR